MYSKVEESRKYLSEAKAQKKELLEKMVKADEMGVHTPELKKIGADALDNLNQQIECFSKAIELSNTE